MRSFGVIRFSRVRPGGSWVDLGSLGSIGFALGVVGFAVGVVGFICGCYVHLGSPWVSFGSSGVVEFTRIRPGGR